MAGYPGECLDTAGWRLQFKADEQGNIVLGSLVSWCLAVWGGGGSQAEDRRLGSLSLFW